MIRKSGDRFSEGIMLNQEIGASDNPKHIADVRLSSMDLSAPRV
jgi:hypothetical protein